MSCHEAMRLQEYFDGELDANAAVAIETHLETCTDCAALLRDLEVGRHALRDSASYHRASDALRSRIGDALREEAGERLSRRVTPLGASFWSGALSGGGVTALAAALAFFLLLPPSANLLVGDLTNAHLRAMMSDHLVDVVSSDRHTVKPWFAGHTDVSPPAIDYAQHGFTLVGGRADYVDGRRAAVVVYRHGKHIVNLFAWIAGDESLPAPATRNGYHLIFWKSGNVAYCAISDTAPNELMTLVRLIQKAAPSRD